MTELGDIRNALEGVSSAFNRVLAEAPIESDHYSIGFDCVGTSIRINLQDMRTIVTMSAAQPVAWANFKDDGTLVGLSEDKPDSWTGAKPLYASPIAPPVVVKALDWKNRGDDTFLSEPMEGVFRYHVWQSRNGEWHNSADPNRRPLKTEKDAKAVCQADYEDRIRSALA